MKKTAVCKWGAHFSEGRESVTDDERSEWPATSRTEENIAKFIKLCMEIVGYQEHTRASEYQCKNLPRVVLTSKQITAGTPSLFVRSIPH
jgi:hypothetical protein